MSSQRAKCCAIVVTFNGIEWIEKCISSLESSTVDIDIIAVDNGSNDRTLEFLDDKSDIKNFRNSSNVGFGKANNLGLEYAFAEGYEYFLLLNQDAWVEEDTAAELIKGSHSASNIGVLSPVHMNGSGQGLDVGFKKYMRLRESSGFYQDFKSGKLSEEIYEVSFVNAAAWLVTRDCLATVGLFHPLFSHYGEDDNFIHRVKSAGLKLGVLGGARIYHDRDSRFKERIDPKAKFRSMVLMVHLNPLKKRNEIILWMISIGNLLTIPNFWYFFPNLQFYCWGLLAYFKFAKEVQKYGSKQFNPLKSSKSQ